MSAPPVTRHEAAVRLTEAVRRDAHLREREARRLRPVEKARLGVEIVMAHVLVRRNISALPLPELLRLLRGDAVDAGVPAAQLADEHVTAVRLGRAVMGTLRRLPGDTRCLTQSLVLTVLLARRGIGSRLVIAVSPGETFAAHAWVEHGGVPVLPAGAADLRDLVTL